MSQHKSACRCLKRDSPVQPGDAMYFGCTPVLGGTLKLDSIGKDVNRFYCGSCHKTRVCGRTPRCDEKGRHGPCRSLLYHNWVPGANEVALLCSGNMINKVYASSRKCHPEVQLTDGSYRVYDSQLSTGTLPGDVIHACNQWEWTKRITPPAPQRNFTAEKKKHFFSS